MMAVGGPFSRGRRLNRRSARRVAARRRARLMAGRAVASLESLRHSFAVTERTGAGPRPCAPNENGLISGHPLSLSSPPYPLNPPPAIKDKFSARAAAATSAASIRRADALVEQRCASYVKALPPERASDQGLASPHPNGSAGAFARRASALQALGLSPIPSESGVASAPPARAIRADVMSFPEAAAGVDLLHALPPALCARYSTAAPTAWTADSGADRPPTPPKPCSLTGGREWPRFAARMWRAGAVVFLNIVLALCGVFAVDKPDGRLRAITDARPANWHFAEPESVALPTPDTIARLRAPFGAAIFVARTDAADFYHCFRTPQWMWPLFGLPRVRVGDLDLPAGAVPRDAGEWVYPALRTLPMGFSHAVLLAQSAHTHLLDTLPHLFSRADRLGDALCTDYTLRPGRVMHAVCIDDLLLFGLEPALVAHRQQQYLEAGRRAGYVYKPEKTVLPTADGAPVLGLELHGRAGTLRLAPSKMEALVAATRAAVAQRRMRAIDFQSLVGRWVWAVLPCRPALSIFSAVFALAQRMRRGTVALWPSVCRELTAAADLAPLLLADLTAQPFGVTVASDASSTGLGVVALRGVTAAVPPGASVPGVSSVAATAVPPHCASTVVSSRWRWAEHINVLELRAAHVALRWVLRHALPGGVRLSLWTDSAVVVGAMRKGRSGSTSLNRLLRAVASDLLRAGVSVDVDWIQSALNPADAPSRS